MYTILINNKEKYYKRLSDITKEFMIVEYQNFEDDLNNLEELFSKKKFQSNRGLIEKFTYENKNQVKMDLEDEFLKMKIMILKKVRDTIQQQKLRELIDKFSKKILSYV